MRHGSLSGSRQRPALSKNAVNTQFHKALPQQEIHSRKPLHRYACHFRSLVLTWMECRRCKEVRSWQ